jgi:hypothetical protein
MPNPPKMRDRLLDRDSSSDESGFVLVFVLILSVALFTMLTFAVTSSVGNLDNSANYSNSAQAQNSAMAGLSIATDQMTTAGLVANLPCSIAPTSMLVPKVSNTSDTYSVSIAYSDFGGAHFDGDHRRGTPRVKTVVMQETMVIDATSTLLGAFTYAIFSHKTLTLQNGLTINSPSSCIGPGGSSVPAPCGNLYGGALNNCQNSSFIDGSVQVADSMTASLTIGNKCEIKGDLYVNGSVTLNNTAQVDGSIHAYGGNVTLNQSSSVGGSIYATAVAGVGGTINIDTNYTSTPTVGGSLYAATTVTATIAGIVQDVINLLPLLGVSGSVNFPVPSDSMPAVPQSQTFPQLNPTAASLAASKGDAGGDLYTVIPIGGSATTCSTLFQAAAQATYSTPTAIYAPTCVVSLNGSNTFNLGSNEIWVVGGFSEGGGLTVQATGSTGPFDLSVVVPIGGACPAGDIGLKGNSFAVSIKVLLYTPCDVSFTGDQTMDGQILAGGTIGSTGNLTLGFDQSALAYLPGTQGAPVLTLLVTSKTVTNG